YDKGRGVHALSKITYYLGGACSSFTADVGPEWGFAGNVIFTVDADDENLYQSRTFPPGFAPEKVDVDLTGKQYVDLVVKAPGSTNGAHGVWGGRHVPLRVIPGWSWPSVRERRRPRCARRRAADRRAAGSATASADGLDRHLHRDHEQIGREEDVAGQRLDHRRQPRAQRRHRAGGEPDDPGGDQVDVAVTEIADRAGDRGRDHHQQR